MTTTPLTREPYLSGTATTDSSMSSVFGIVTANSQSIALASRSERPVSATQPVKPSPNLQVRSSALSSVYWPSVPLKAIGKRVSPSAMYTRQLW